MIGELAQMVTESLDGSGLFPGITAVRSYAPQYELADMDTLHVTVVPKGLAVTVAGRTSSQYDCQIDVAVQRRLQSDDLQEIDALLAITENVASYFRQKPLGDGVSCVKTEHQPVYAPEHLRELRQFTSVITLTLRKVAHS